MREPGGTTPQSHTRSGDGVDRGQCTQSGAPVRSPHFHCLGSVSWGLALLGRSSWEEGRRGGHSPACGRRCLLRGGCSRSLPGPVCGALSVGVLPTPPLVNKAAQESFMGSCLKIDETRPRGLIPNCRAGRCWAHRLPREGVSDSTTGWVHWVLGQGPGAKHGGLRAQGLAGSLHPAVVSELLRHEPGGVGSWEGEQQPPPRGTWAGEQGPRSCPGAVTRESRRPLSRGG